MKTTALIALLLIATATQAQRVVSDTLNFVKASAEREVIDPTIFKKLEKFNDSYESIVYVYRLSSYVGAAGIWKVKVDNKLYAQLLQLEVVAIHISTAVKTHHFQLGENYMYFTGFKPNRYYYVQLKGVDIKTGYLNAETLNQIKTCEKAQPIPKVK